MSKRKPTVEHHMNEVIGDYVTGGRYNMISALFYFFTKIGAVWVACILHYRIGIHYINRSSVFYGWWIIIAWMFILALTGGGASVPLFWYFGLLFLVLGIYRYFEAYLNHKRKRTVSRFSLEPGTSYLWKPLKWVLRRLNLVIEPGGDRPLWKCDEWRFQRFLEPVLVVLLGYFLGNKGYTAFGTFVMVAGCCSFMQLRIMEGNAEELIIAGRNAQILSGIMETPDSTPKRNKESAKPLQKKTLRSSRDFKKWKQEQSVRRVENHALEDSDDLTELRAS